MLCVGAETHFKVVVVSDSFQGMPLIKVVTPVTVCLSFLLYLNCIDTEYCIMGKIFDFLG